MNNQALNIIKLFSILFILSIIIFLQFANPYLYEVDGYYHIKVPSLIKEHGFRYDFPWAKFSTFSRSYSDKEFLFHLLIIPFTFISNNFHAQVRVSIIFFIILFLIAFSFILKKYIIYRPLHVLSILSIPLSTLFLFYMNYLRPKTLAISIILVLLYFLIENNWIGIFILSTLYPLIHISYPFCILLCLGIEILRYLYYRKFVLKNLLFCILGIVLGIFIHPNFPNNFVSLHLNAFFVPWHTMFGNIALNYGMEWNPLNTKTALLDFLILFTGLFFIILILSIKNLKLSFHTLVFFVATSFFFFLSMFSTCYWYFTYPTGILFLSMFFSDFLGNNSHRIKTLFLCLAGIVLISRAFLIKRADGFSNELTNHINLNSHYERIGNWMNKNIPPGEVIYHTSWSDSPYFICLNPKDYYLTMLDPIYMYYYSPNIYNLYNNLSNGFCDKPAKMLKKVFKSRYGYTGKGYGLYNQIKNHKGFKILFEDEYGAIFQLVKSKKVP